MDTGSRRKKGLLGQWFGYAAGILGTIGTVGGFLSHAPAAPVPPPARPFEVEAIEDVPYYEGADADPVRHKLDLFLPRGRKDYPVLFLVHGGGWLIGDKSTFGRYSAVGRYFASMGVGVVVPGYRLSPAVQHPEHVRDVARAFAWTYQNLGRYGGRADQIFLLGHSAGGHLVSLLATDGRYLQAHGLSHAAIRGVISISGVYRIPDGSPLVSGIPRLRDLPTVFDNLSLRVAPLGRVFGDDPRVRREASPINHVAAGLPPFLLLYAQYDIPPVPTQAEEFATALKAAGCDVQLLEALGRNHLSALFWATDPRDPVARVITQFMCDHLQPANTSP